MEDKKEELSENDNIEEQKKESVVNKRYENWGLISMILGIVAIFSIFGGMGFFVAVAAIILGMVELFQKKENKSVGKAISGIIMGGFSIIVSFIMFIFLLMLFMIPTETNFEDQENCPKRMNLPIEYRNGDYGNFKENSKRFEFKVMDPVEDKDYEFKIDDNPGNEEFKGYQRIPLVL